MFTKDSLQELAKEIQEAIPTLPNPSLVSAVTAINSLRSFSIHAGFDDDDLLSVSEQLSSARPKLDDAILKKASRAIILLRSLNLYIADFPPHA